MRFALAAVLLLLNLPAQAQTNAPVPVAAASPASEYPFWVEVTQEYKFPGTEWISTAGLVEQVIGEDEVNWIVTSSDGEQLKLPKAFSKKVSAEVAAVKLFTERKQNYDLYMGQLVREDEIMKAAKAKIGEYETANQQLQANIAEYQKAMTLAITFMKSQNQGGGNAASIAAAQQALQLMQQLGGGSGNRGGGGSISKSDRARMEKDVWAAGLATSLYVARGMSDADLQQIWPQARQILETRAAGNRR